MPKSSNKMRMSTNKGTFERYSFSTFSHIPLEATDFLKIFRAFRLVSIIFFKFFVSYVIFVAYRVIE